MKIVILIMLAGVVISLGSALSSMTSPADHSERMLRALTIRVVMSIGLVVTLLVSWKLGYIEPPVRG